MEGFKNIINFVIISLDDKFSKNVATILADNLDMYVVNTKDMIA